MRRIYSIVLAAAMTFSSSPLFAARAGGRGDLPTGSISGTATGSGGQTVHHATVQLRDLGTGQLVGSTTSDGAGQFTFTGLNAGNYAVELVNAAGEIVATSASIVVGEGASVTGFTIAAPVMSGEAEAKGPRRRSTAVIVTTVAAASGVAALIAVAHNASPSK